MAKAIPIRVMDCWSARKHVPCRKTYAIRLFSTDRGCNRDYGKLNPSKLYVAIREYYFDDIDYVPDKEEGSSEDYECITDDIARKIITDFAEYKGSIDELLVHCRVGLSRSPAVALALQDIFKLGTDRRELIEDYQGMNQFVYSIMIKNGHFAGK